MKKSAKIILIISAILFCLGCACTITGFAMTNFDLSHFNYEEYTEHTQDIKESFTDIEINTISDDIIFLLSDNDECRVKYFDSNDIEYKLDCSENKLSIIAETKMWLRFDIFSFGTDHSVEIYLPKKAYDNLNVNSVSGNIRLEKNTGITFKKYNMNTTSGEINTYIEGNSTELNTTSGDISLEGKLAADLKINTISGDITLNNVNSDNLDVNTTSGDFKLIGTDAKSIHVNTISGDISGELYGKKNISVNTVSGDKDLPTSYPDGDNCSFDTVSGDIKLSGK